MQKLGKAIHYIPQEGMISMFIKDCAAQDKLFL